MSHHTGGQSRQPVLFLDFDGVLNDHSTYRTYDHRGLRHPLEPRLIRAVGDLVKTVDGRIVLSTAWRHAYPLSVLTPILASGIDEWRIIGSTPKGRTRGREIEAWLQAHVQTARVAVLDDQDVGPFDMAPMRPWFVQTRDGVTADHLQRVERLMTAGTPWTRAEKRRAA